VGFWRARSIGVVIVIGLFAAFGLATLVGQAI
jgi:hypothetical protein